MQRISRIIAAAVALGALAACDARSDAKAGDDAAVQTAAAAETVTFAVDKMTCAACPITVRKAMEKVEGVSSVKVDYATRTATVTFDPAVATPQQIGAASTQAGYPAAPQRNSPSRGELRHDRLLRQ